MSTCYICQHPETPVNCDKCEKKFCSAKHLNLHINPQGFCLPYRIEISPEEGRHLVADKDIKAGELILSEDCLGWGPNHVADRYCIECLIPVNDQVSCEFCGYYLCSLHLDDHPVHQIECRIFQEKGFKLSSAVREYDMEAAYPLIAPLRCIRLKEENPESWRILSNLMDHRKERMSEPDIYIEPYRHDVIDKLAKELAICTEEEAISVIGYLDVNSMAVRGGDGVYRGRGLYPIASLMNHECICNSRNIITKTRLETRATIDIKCGESITTHYVSPLLPLNVRREKLLDRWFFSCQCARCQSKTDLGAYTSALKCGDCPGYLLPSNPSRTLRRDE